MALLVRRCVCLSLLTTLVMVVSGGGEKSVPIVITTWNFTNATTKAWEVIQGGSALDAVEEGCSVCEREQCDGTVGYGGSPDGNGETTLDAMMMDGSTFNVGAVAAMRRIKPAISVARRVLEQTRHSLLVGEMATQFALQMGYTEESLGTPHSKEMWKQWRSNNCQPNFWTHVVPDPTKQCGPYQPASDNDILKDAPDHDFGGPGNHDTIGMVAIDAEGHIVAGTSTNGATYKIPGRVGDSPIPGAGAYADSRVGGAAATGDGDVMLRFLPSYQAVESMRQGLAPAVAARGAVERIVDFYPDFEGAVVAVNKEGIVGAACYGLKQPFPFSVGNAQIGGVKEMSVDCVV